MMSKTLVRAKAASVKVSVDAVHSAIEALPPGPEKDAVADEFDRLHRKLNGAARRISEVFEEPIETFSGGDDRPDEE